MARQKVLDNLTTTKLYNSHLPLTELQLSRLWWLLRLHHSRRMSFSNLKGIHGMGLPEPMLVVKHLLRGDPAGNPKRRCLVAAAEVQAPQGQQQQHNPHASKSQVKWQLRLLLLSYKLFSKQALLGEDHPRHMLVPSQFPLKT